MCHFKTLVFISLFFSINHLALSQDFSDYVLLHEQTVYFENDQFTLDSSEIKKIIAFESYTDNYKGAYFFKINTHTDHIGSEQYNQDLSKKRMIYIQDILEKEGALSSRIQSQYHGETSPIATQDDDEGKQLNRRGVIELFKKTIPTVINITDDRDNPISDAMINWHQKSRRGSVITDSSGRATILLPYIDKFSVQVIAKDHFFSSRDITVGKDIAIPMLKLEMGQVYSVKSLYFRGGSSAMMTSSIPVLQAVYETLRINDDLCLEIAGHVTIPKTSEQRYDPWQHELSIARSIIIADSLIHKGISKDRLISKGYGSTKLKHLKPKNDDQHAENRRVEFIVKDCNAINKMESDSLVNKASFYYDPLLEKFMTLFLDTVGDRFSKKEQKALFKTLRRHRENNIDSKKYTLGELIEEGMIK